MLTTDDGQASRGEGSNDHGAKFDCASIGRDDGFAVAAESGPPRMALALKGELDLATVPALERAIEALPWPQLTELVFDLARLTFIDSTGLSALIRASQRAAATGLRFSVIRIPNRLRAVFTITGVADRLNLEP